MDATTNEGRTERVRSGAVAIDGDTSHEVGRRRLSGAPLWSGFVVALATWILLDLALAAVDLVPFGFRSGGFEATELWWSGIASIVALALGGFVAAMTSRSHSAIDGVVQGVVVWAITVVAIVVLGALGTGLGFGALGISVGAADTQAQVPPAQQQQAEEADIVLDQDEFQEAAGYALLFLALTLVAAAGAGAAGSKASASEDRTVDGD